MAAVRRTLTCGRGTNALPCPHHPGKGGIIKSVNRIGIRIAVAILLAAAGLLAGSCSLPPGTIELTVANTVGMNGNTGTLVIMIRESESSDLVSSGQVAGRTLLDSDPYEYSYGGASEGLYTVIAFLDVNTDGTMNAGDIVPTFPFPSAAVLSEQTTTVTITLDHVN
jgi:uncharacterized protein (DUF2141 family)